MAPQSSAISSSPPSRRSKFNRNRLALIDPSSIRRSPRLTPVASTGGSVGILKEARGLLMADLSGGRVKRLSVERRLIADNLEGIGGGAIGKENGGGGGIGKEIGGGGGGIGKEIGRGGGGVRVKRLSVEQRLIADNLERNGCGGLVMENGGGGGIGKEICGRGGIGKEICGGGGGIGKEVGGCGVRVKRLSVEQRLIAENSERNGGGGLVKEISGGGGGVRVKRLSVEQRLIAENLERNGGDGIGKDFGRGGRDKSLTSEHWLIAENSERICGSGILKEIGGGGGVRVKRLSAEQRLIAANLERSGGGGEIGKEIGGGGRVKSLTSEHQLIAENLERIGGGGRVKRLSTEQRLIAENLERNGSGGIGMDFSGGSKIGGKSGRKRSWTCTDLIDPNSIRRSTRLRQNRCDDVDASQKIEFLSLEDGISNRRPRKSGGGCGVKSMRVEHEDPLRILGSDSAEISLEDGSRRKKMRMECSVESLPNEKGKKGSAASFFIGDPVPEEEANKRWPWRFEKEKKSRKPPRLEPDVNEDELVLNVKCHYLQAKVEKSVFYLGDYAYVQGENGGENYIGKIIEFFKTKDDKDYFRVQWFFRATDTVMKEAGESHDRKRVFYSDLMNDNLLDCIVSKLKIVQVKPNANKKAKAILECDFYYDMKYSVDYSTFCTMSSRRSFSSSLDREPFDLNGTVNEVDDQNSNKPCKSELTLLDIYAGCGAMSTGLSLGAKVSGLQLSTKWAIDINKSACETLKLNHPGTQVRNESAEDFLYLLKEWETLCKRYGVNSKGDFTVSNTNSLRTDEKSIQSSTCEKSTSSEFEVERIVDICYNYVDDGGKRGLKFKVRWAGYGPSEDTWEPVDGLRKCQDAIKDFVRKGYSSKILPLPGDVDVICGGPPCQGISGYNRFRNVVSPMDDERNHQIVVFMDLVKYLRPKYVLMENVSDLLKFAKGTLGRYALSRLVQMNYQARLGIMAAGCYGLAQYRLRVFLWAADPFHHLPQFPLPTHDVVIRYGAPTEFERNIVAYDEGQTRKLEKALVLADAIFDLPPIFGLESREVMTYSKPPSTVFQKYIRASESEMLGFAYCAAKQTGKTLLYDHRPFPLSADDYLRVCLIPRRKGANFRDLPGVTVDHNNVAKRDATTEILLPSGKPYVPEYALNLGDGKSMRPFARLWWDETVPTVLCKMDSHSNAVLHPEQDRILSLRECARLQGFPDYYRFCGDLKDRYSQVGNAVAVPVARALGYALGMVYQQMTDPSQHLITLPSNFSHSTTYELLALKSLPASTEERNVN